MYAVMLYLVHYVGMVGVSVWSWGGRVVMVGCWGMLAGQRSGWLAAWCKPHAHPVF